MTVVPSQILETVGRIKAKGKRQIVFAHAGHLL